MSDKDFTYDLSTKIGRVRLRVPDNDKSFYIFTDDEIEAFLAEEGNSVPLAAAEILDTIAANEAYKTKAIKSMSLSTRGDLVAAELRARARTLRERAARGDREDLDGDFEVAERVTSEFGYRQKIRNERLRNA